MLKIYKTCEDMTYPFTTAVTVTTEYRIYDSSGHTPDNNYTPLHSCVVLAGDHLEHLQDILAQHVSISDRTNWNGNAYTEKEIMEVQTDGHLGQGLMSSSYTGTMTMERLHMTQLGT